MEHDVRRVAAEVLATHNYVTVATHGPAGLWIATVWYAERWTDDGLDLLINLKPEALTLANLRAEPEAAFAINGPQPDRFIQGKAQGQELGLLREADDIRRRLLDKAPTLQRFVERIPDLVAVRLRVTELFVTDHGKGIGRRTRVPLTPGVPGDAD
ncbi:MAG: pyridoxamine 5'-phosphate oxidase family protein [Firmicutes bacterium]|nr:pyridoxamine 5'-phosphate oxidase family protein [Bacillota bacterium]